MADWNEFFDSALSRARPITGASRDSFRLTDESRANERLAGVRHPHVSPVPALSAASTSATFRSPARATVRSAREWIPWGRSLSPGEVVTLGAGLARGLAALHAAGLTRRGDLGLDDVVIDDDGRPLWQWGEAAPRTGDDGAHDVAALAATLRELLADRTAPGPLTLVLLRADDEDPRRRPSAAHFADALIAACSPSPLTWPQSTDGAEPDAVDDPGVNSVESHALTEWEFPELRARMLGPIGARPLPSRHNAAPVDTSLASPPRPRVASPGVVRTSPPRDGWWQRMRWRIIAIAVLTALVLVGVLRGVAAETRSRADPSVPASPPSITTTESPIPTLAGTVALSESPSESTSPTAAAAPTPGVRAPALPWVAVLSGLDTIRDSAFAAANPAPLLRADAAGSSALNSDRSTIAALRSAGVTARGYAVQVISAIEKTRTATSVVLTVIDRVSDYDLVDSAGRVRDHVAARSDAPWTITLVTQGANSEWRLSDVTADEGTATSGVAGDDRAITTN